MKCINIFTPHLLSTKYINILNCVSIRPCIIHRRFYGIFHIPDIDLPNIPRRTNGWRGTWSTSTPSRAPSTPGWSSASTLRRMWPWQRGATLCSTAGTEWRQNLSSSTLYTWVMPCPALRAWCLSMWVCIIARGIQRIECHSCCWNQDACLKKLLFVSRNGIKSQHNG